MQADGKPPRWVYQEESKPIDNALKPRANTILVGHVVKRIANYVTRSVRLQADSRFSMSYSGIPCCLPSPVAKLSPTLARFFPCTCTLTHLRPEFTNSRKQIPRLGQSSKPPPIEAVPLMPVELEFWLSTTFSDSSSSKTTCCPNSNMPKAVKMKTVKNMSTKVAAMSFTFVRGFRRGVGQEIQDQFIVAVV